MRHAVRPAVDYWKSRSFLAVMNTVTPIFPSAHATFSPAVGKPSLLARIADMRFVSVSVLIHAILVIFGGSVVLMKSAVQPPDFVAGDGELITPEDASSAAPPESPPAPAIPQYQASISPTALNLSVITTAAARPTGIQVSAAPAVAQLDAKLSSPPGGGKGITDKLAGIAGGGIKGGTRGFFGMRASKDSVGLVGTFYDAKQTRSRKPTNIDNKQFADLLSRFVREGWKESILNDYYKAPNNLSATQIFIPNMSADEGPKAFEVDKEVQPSRWLVHYRGKIAPPRDGNFRFVGAGDDYLVVRLNGKVVLDHGFSQTTNWQPQQYYNYGWTAVPKGFARGDKFHAYAGQYSDLEILISEKPGGWVFFCLMLEDQDMEYKKDPKGNPILPVFRLADGPMPELAKGQTLPPYDPNAPIWKSQSIRGTSDFSQMFGSK